MSTPALSPERSTVIGASEIAAALGVAPGRSRLALASEKLGLVDPDDLSGNPRVWAGRILEDGIANAYAGETGAAVVLHDPNWLRHPEHHFLGCSPDGIATLPSGERRGLEIKYVSADVAHRWDNEPPLSYLLQAQQELMILHAHYPDIERLDLAGFVAGPRPYLMIRTLEADPALEAIIVSGGREFWDLIERGELPEPDGSESSSKAISKLWAVDDGSTVELPGTADAWTLRLAELNAQIDGLERERDDLRNHLKTAIGSAAYGRTPAGHVWAYPTIQRRAYEVKASSYRQLKLTKGAK